MRVPLPEVVNLVPPAHPCLLRHFGVALDFAHEKVGGAFVL